MFDIGNFFAIKKAKKRAKDGTSSGGGDKNLPFMTVMIDENGAGGVDRDVVGNVVKMEISGCGWRMCGGWRRGDWNEVRSGEVGEGVVEEVGDVRVAGDEEGGGKVSVGLTLVEFAGKGFAFKFADDNSTSSEDILASLPGSYKGKAGNFVSF